MPKSFDTRYVVNRETGCWIWARRTESKSYGWCGKRTNAHRKAWEDKNGPVPLGLLVLHKCGIKLCVNPDHLYVGTGSQNNYDAVEAGTFRGAQITPQMRIEIFDLLTNTEMSQQEIADVYGVSEMTVGRIGSRRGYKRGRRFDHLVSRVRPRGQEAPNSKLTDAQRDQIFDMRFSGWSYQKIGAAYGVTEGAVAYIWLQRGYRRRAFAPRVKKGSPDA